MSIEDVIALTGAGPATVDSLARDLARLGVGPGATLMVHSSLSALGYVNGGAPAVIAALESTLGATGTLAMPTHSSGLSDPAHWAAPAVPAAWHRTIRDTMPAYDPATTPTRNMGAVAENFRSQPSVRRSAHPRQSCAARGPQAARIADSHALDCAMGERSPLARLYELDAWILLLGVGHGRNTSLHLAEYRASFPGKRLVPFASPVTIDGVRHWHVIDDLDFSDADFPQLGDDYERDTGGVTIGRVARATARLMRARPLIDYAIRWLPRGRQHPGRPTSI